MTRQQRGRPQSPATIRDILNEEVRHANAIIAAAARLERANVAKFDNPLDDNAQCEYDAAHDELMAAVRASYKRRRL